MTDQETPDIGEIRGEKIVFRREDIVPLDAMPSAKSRNTIRVPEAGRRNITFLFARFLMGLMVFATLGIAALVYAIENGMADETLTKQASEALNKALAPNLIANVGSAGIRFSKDGHLAIEARDVTLHKSDGVTKVMNASSVQLFLAPLDLLTGNVTISSVEMKSMHLDPAGFPNQQPFDFTDFRISDVPTYLDVVYSKLDEAFGVLTQGGTKSLRIDDTHFTVQNLQGRHVDVVVSSLNFLRNQADHVSANGTILFDNKPMNVNLDIALKNQKWSSAKIFVSQADITPMTLTTNLSGLRRDGFSGKVDLELMLNRGDEGQDPLLNTSIKTENSLMFADGHAVELSSGAVHLTYDFKKRRFEILPSEVTFGTTRIPFEAAVADQTVDDTHPDHGVQLSWLTSNALLDVKASGEQPMPFDFISESVFTPKTGLMVFNKLQLSTPGGVMAGSATIHFEGLSPEISFAGEANVLKIQAIKQLWPFWIAPKVRKWAHANVFDGQIKNASVEVFIPKDRMHLAPGHMDLDETQLKLAFDGEKMRINIPGDMPPLRDAAGHFDMKGPNLLIHIASGGAYLPSGRTAKIADTIFEIPKSHVRPLLANISLNIGGDVDALAEIASLKPIEALKTTDFAADDFSGTANVQLSATFGMIKEQDPPPPVWKADVALTDSGLSKPLLGRKITSVDGKLTLDPLAAKLVGQGKIDGIDAKMAATLPVKPGSDVKRDISVSGTLGSKDLKALAPGVSAFVQGAVAIEYRQTTADDQSIKLDLANASLTVPWIGWSKGSGVPAKASFSMQTADGVTQIDDLTFSGDGFGLAGKMELGKQGLNSATFSSVKLSASDSFSLSLKKNKNEDYRVAVTGKSMDLRPILAKLKNQPAASSDDTSNLVVTADLARATGFQNEAVNNLKLEYGSNSGSLTRLTVSGVSDSGQAIVASLAADGDGKSVQLTAGDAGALARFTDLYKNMQNGLMNMRLKQRGPGSWVGNVDIRKFQLLNEDRLQTIVSTPAGENGKSLNDAVKRDIDVRSEKFARGFASLVIKNGVIQIDNGVVRGEQVGATFQGTVRDANGKTDITGTFMPAYGLNRLFAELPLIGIILGNGRDRGLLGITFKLSGPFEKPQLTINPLSIIAPGVFRSIFEFQ